MPTFYPSGNRSLPSDDEKRSLHKIVDLLGGGIGVFSGGSGSVFSGHYGGGPPTQTPAANTVGATAYDLDAPFATWQWNPDTLSWF